MPNVSDAQRVALLNPIARGIGGPMQATDAVESRSPEKMLPPVAQGEPRHVAALDGIRGLAILLVLLFHTGTMLRDPGTGRTAVDRVYEKIMLGGWCGVDLFFVLSGFLITGILFASRPQPRYFYNFYGRRVLRIFPLYYAFLFVITIAIPVGLHLLHKKTGGNHAAIWAWLYVSNFSIAARGNWNSGNLLDITWSLSIEEQFYLVWPLLVWLLDRRKMMGVCLALIVIVPALRAAALYHGINPTAVQVVTLLRIDGLATGAWIALALRGPMPKALLRRIAVAAGLVGAAVITAVVVTTGGFEGTDRAVQMFGYTALTLVFGCLIALAVTPFTAANRVAAVLGIAPLTFFGQYSYAIYLLNRPLLSLARDHLFRSVAHKTVLGSMLPVTLAFQATVIAITAAAAMVSWHVFEKRFLSLKRYFSNHGKPPQEA